MKNTYFIALLLLMFSCQTGVAGESNSGTTDDTSTTETIESGSAEEETDPEILEFIEGEMPVTDNLGLTEEGVLFLYNIYEIAPYVAGAIEVLLPYEGLRERGLLSDAIDDRVGDL